ncbi:unnamed protein product [Rotaria magnacalcarata]|uniref:EGF-like domain-containing protein n=2 Tax=Rotaria magnacalcarata TaxID=392030 RepID=A0A815K8D4_9BILA|nr:unnamed protein product [Rotaria magnacalcarata]
MRLCDDYASQRLANCFEFNHNMKSDCSGQSVCENEGQRFQDSSDYSKNSTCICQSCFYGARCQLSSDGFVLSLDAIIGYHIQPHTNIIHQPIIIKITVALTVIFMFWILLLAQMAIISNRLFLRIQSLSLDFLLSVCINMNQWLNATVTIERTITIKKGINFNTKINAEASDLHPIVMFTSKTESIYICRK